MKRAEAREQMHAQILSAARQEIAVHGGGALSMRAIAREVGLVSSAIYRYFPTREALLTAMITESYGNLAEALASSGADRKRNLARRWETLGRAFRVWSMSNPHEFQLIYGTPIPGYVAPAETIPAAEAVAVHFLATGAQGPVGAFNSTALSRQVGPIAGALDLNPSGTAAVIAEIAALVGMLTAEIAGHFVGTADPADHLFEAFLRRQTTTLGLS
ncbi:TetR/AcrR family transcriptional regulator [Nocardioides dubius]|uniref:TetR/AcrR family transcriptional regulator n=1 Tax=Nocardioides dubius TaxID=317019 RepID=A0ABN1TW01_9ACTN